MMTDEAGETRKLLMELLSGFRVMEEKLDRRPTHERMSDRILDANRALTGNVNDELGRIRQHIDNEMTRIERHYEDRQNTFFKAVEAGLDTRVGNALDKMIKRQDSQRNMLVGGAVVIVAINAAIPLLMQSWGG